MSILLRRAPRRVLSGLLVVFGLGCAADREPGAAVDRTLVPVVDTLFTVGRVDGPDAESFAWVAEVRIDARSRVLVLDEPNRRVQVFGPDGAFRRSLARGGRGPGELQIPVSLAPAGDGVALLDIGRDRVVVLDSAGAPRRELTLPEGVGRVRLLSAGPDAFFLTGDGNLFDEPDSVVVYRYRPSHGNAPEPLFRVPNPQHEPQVGSMTRSASGSITLRRRSRASFFPEVHLAAGGHHLAVAHGYGYSIQVRDLDGRPVGMLKRPLAPVPVDDALRERERERLRSTVRALQSRGGAGAFGVRAMTPADVDALAADLLFPDTVPVVLGLRGAPDGSFWVLRAAEDPIDPDRIDIFGADGVYSGTVEGVPLPDALGPEGLAAWVEEGPLGVPRVRVGRVRFGG